MSAIQRYIKVMQKSNASHYYKGYWIDYLKASENSTIKAVVFNQFNKTVFQTANCDTKFEVETEVKQWIDDQGGEWEEPEQKKFVDFSGLIMPPNKINPQTRALMAATIYAGTMSSVEQVVEAVNNLIAELEK